MRNFKFIFLFFTFLLSSAIFLIGQPSNTVNKSSYLSSNTNLFLNDLTPNLKNVAKKIYPDGTILMKENLNVNTDELLSLVGLQSNCTFVLQREKDSRFNSEISYKYYQQYFNNIKIDGGGYTMKIDKQTNKILQFSPNIISNINISVNTAITKPSLEIILNVDKVSTSEILITERFGELKLVWYGFVTRNDKTIQFWVDANTGEILEQLEEKLEINADTPTYGTQNLNDNTQNGVTTMEWPNQTPYNSLRIFESNYTTNPVNPNQWNVNDIPNTTNAVWGTDANITSRQSLYTANLVIPEFLNMGVDFGNVSIACHTTPNSGAFAFFGATVENAFVNFGLRAGIPVSVFDIMAHELGHVYLNEFLGYTNPTGNMALHEGIADLIGSYIEGFIQPNGADWVTGDDEQALANIYNRDQTVQVCFNNIQNNGHHQVGRVISHWFFAISTGIAADEIPALGIQVSMDILTEALSNLNNRNAGFQQMRAQTLLVAETNFGVCSPQYRAVVNAWDRVCIIGDSQACPCNSYAIPGTSTNSIALCSNNINLNSYHNGSIPSGAVLIWSTDNNPLNGVDPILSGNITQTGIYFPYYFNSQFNCFSNPGIGVNVTTSCNNNNLVISSTSILQSNSSIDFVKIHSSGVLIIPSGIVLEVGNKIEIDLGGKLIIDGGTVKNCSACPSWQGIQAWGNPFAGQSDAVELKNGAIIENAEIGINTSNVVPGFFLGTLIDLSGAKVTSENSTIRNCGIGVNFGPYGYSGPWFSWGDQSYFTNTTFANCGTGAILQSNLGVEFTGSSFTGSNTIGIEVKNSQIDVTGCDFAGYQGILFSATWPSLVGSNITNNTFFSADGIFIDAQGNATPHQILGNFFGSEVGLLGFGQSAFNIQANDFANNNGGVSSWYTGDDYNLVSENGFLGNEYGTSAYGDNNIEYLDNCFDFSVTADIELYSGASIFPLQGSEFEAAGNCFSFGATKILTGSGSVPFDYFVKTGTIPQSCKKPGIGNFTEQLATNDFQQGCGSGVWTTLPPKYRNCIIPDNLKDKKLMEDAIKAEIIRIKNDPNIPLVLKKQLIARYEKCLKKLKGLIGLQIIKEETDGKEKAITYFSSQPLFSHKIMAYAIMMESDELGRATAYLNGLTTQNIAQSDFVFANNLYLSYLNNRNGFLLTNATKASLKEKAMAPNELSGYARSIYYALTGERLRIPLSHSQHVKPRTSDFSNSLKGIISSYPNPVTGNEHIVAIKSIDYDQKFVINISDIMGRVIKSVIGVPGENVIDMTDISDGIFIVEVISGNDRVFTTKVVRL